MPYNPAQYVRPRTGLRMGTAAIGQALTQIPGEIRQEKEYSYLQEQRRIAVEEAKKNWGDMESAVKVLKKQYGKMVQPLLESNQMTFDEYSTNINMIPQPTQADKKDPGAYLDKLGQSYGTLVKEAKKRIRTQEIVPEIGTAIQGGEMPERQVTETTGYQPTARAGAAYVPAQAEGAPAGAYSTEGGQVGGFQKHEPVMGERTLPAGRQPAATTKEEAYGRLPSEKAITTGEFEEYGGKYLPTGMDVKKQKALEEYKKKVLSKGFGEDGWKKVKWKYEYMQDERARDSRTELSLEDDKRMLKQFENQIRKSGQIDVNDMERAKDMGIDPQALQTGGEDLLVEIRELQKQTDIRVGEQREKSQDTENTLKELDRNPYMPIGKLRESGRKSVYEGQEGRQLSQKMGLPPMVGGRKQIGGTQTPAETIQKKKGTGF